jgi:hypothetical protein
MIKPASAGQEVPMGSRRKTYGQVGALALVAIMLVACSSSTVTWPPAISSAASAVPAGSGVHVAIPDESGARASQAVASEAPRETAAAATVDEITADYTYRSELITPLAHLYGTSGTLALDDFVIVTVENKNAKPVKVVVTSEIAGYTDKSSDTVTIDAGATQEIRQNPRLTTAAIDGLNSQHQADLHVTVSYLDAGQPRTVLDQTSPTLITSRRDFPWTIKGFTPQQTWELVVAMATPTDPKVEELISTAAHQYDPNHASLSGYDSLNDESGSVWQRMSNIWQAEAIDYNLTYVGTTDSFASGSSQRIRLPGEVLDQSSGNCIELTLLYVSVAEAMGLESAIIMIPGHAYVAIRLDNKNDSYYFIETTMIGAATFTEAAHEGNIEWTAAQPHVANSDPDYGWVDIAQARADGVLPIPWR